MGFTSTPDPSPDNRKTRPILKKSKDVKEEDLSEISRDAEKLQRVMDIIRSDVLAILAESTIYEDGSVEYTLGYNGKDQLQFIRIFPDGRITTTEHKSIERRPRRRGPYSRGNSGYGPL